MKHEYEMTKDDLVAILKASKPVVYIIVGGRAPRSPQENANAAWSALGRKMGFRPMTVRPIPSKGDRFFTAEATGPVTTDTEPAVTRSVGHGPQE